MQKQNSPNNDVVEGYWGGGGHREAGRVSGLLKKINILTKFQKGIKIYFEKVK